MKKKQIVCHNCDMEITSESYSICNTCNIPIHDDCVTKCIKCGKILCFTCSIDNAYMCVDCGEERVDKEFAIDFISSTMFESYDKCPFNFYHEHIAKSFSNSEKENKYSANGTLLHAIFEKYSKIRPLNDDTLDEEEREYKTGFEKLNSELFDDEEDIARFKDIGLHTLRNWHNNELTMVVPEATERQEFISFHVDMPKTRVTIDRINKYDNGDIEVWDYKTGKIYSGDMLRDNLQLPIYALAVKELYGKLPKRLILHFPQHDNTLRTFEQTTDDIYICQVKRGGTYTISLQERLAKMVSISKNIKRGIFEPKANFHFCNNFCKTGKANLCSITKKGW